MVAKYLTLLNASFVFANLELETYDGISKKDK
jgi:hypothetical protein